jgi:hypothetical protein
MLEHIDSANAFLSKMLQPINNDNMFLNEVMFFHEATTDQSGNVIKLNMQIWGTENPTSFMEH